MPVWWPWWNDCKKIEQRLVCLILPITPLHQSEPSLWGMRPEEIHLPARLLHYLPLWPPTRQPSRHSRAPGQSGIQRWCSALCWTSLVYHSVQKNIKKSTYTKARLDYCVSTGPILLHRRVLAVVWQGGDAMVASVRLARRRMFHWADSLLYPQPAAIVLSGKLSRHWTLGE